MAAEKILIVEDDPILAEDLHDIVANLGYDTSGVADSFETAQRLAPFSTIAIVDVNLRDGATGPRIGQYLAGDFGIAVVMVTACPDAIGVNLSNVIGVIAKPVNPTVVRNVLEYLKKVREGGRCLSPAEMTLLG